MQSEKTKVRTVMPADREQIRQRFRPVRITTLFVGESAPNNGGFFYCPPDHLLAYFRRAMSLQALTPDEFLRLFSGYGWFLDDLVQQPIDHLPQPERERLCRDAVPTLSERIRSYRPQAVVCLLKKIESNVRDAAADAGISTNSVYGLPFPGNGNQLRFESHFRVIYPKLPKL